MPTHYSHCKGQILRVVVYFWAGTVIKAFVASISHWLVHVKFGKDPLFGARYRQDGWEGEKHLELCLHRQAHLLLWEAIFGTLHALRWLEVCFSIWAATTPQHWGLYRGHHLVLISLLQWTVPLIRLRATTIWLLVSSGWTNIKYHPYCISDGCLDP